MPIDGFIPNLVATVRLYNGYYYQDNEDGQIVASEGMYLRDYRIYGNSYQAEEPSIDNPVEIQSTGDLVTDENDVNYGKYKIPVTVSNGGETTTINIYLDEPLRKVGDYEEYADYIDFRTKKVVRNIGAYTFKGDENAGAPIKNNNVFGVAIGIKNSSKRGDVSRKGLCNYLQQDSINPNTSCFAFHNLQSHPYVYISFERSKFPDYEESEGGNSPRAALKVLKELYDSGNPLKLYYQLQIPTEEPIELPEIPTYKGTNIITVGTSLQPGAVNYQYYKRSEMIW